jgi:hypothetical protein
MVLFCLKDAAMPLLTHLDIVNAACARIGEDPVQTMDDETPQGQAVSLIYEDVVDFNLSLTPFSWAQEPRACSRLANPSPLIGWAYAFDVPGEYFGAPYRLRETAKGAPLQDFELSGRQVHCDCQTLIADVRFRPEPNHWSAPFRSGTITALAARLAFAFASDDKMLQILNAEAYGTPSENCRGGMMRIAINEDARATPPKAMRADLNPLTAARYSGNANLNRILGR